MSTDKMIQVEVAYALPDEQKILAVKVNEGCSALDAVKLSGIVKHFASIDLDALKLGIFGKAIRHPATHVLQAGDRVEMYRELIIDPKLARANRAAKVKAEKSIG